FARFGTEVTIVMRGPSILSGHEPEIAETLTEILREEGVQIITGARVRSVRREGEGVALVGQRHGSIRTFMAERLLVATSRRPNTHDIGLERAGVAVDVSGAVRVDA